MLGLDQKSRPNYVRMANDFSIVCTLFNKPPSGAKALPDTPITYDAHFLIVARIEEVQFGKSPWPAGSLVNFVVHSPTMLFGGRFSGKQFVLTFSPFRPATEEDKTWFAPETQYILRAVERVVSDREKRRTVTADGPSSR